ncbi:hypothetical protein FIBSPDRAFT_878513 [Athelia psychrophila]|uniref:Uncharacterized protein n=1 Tax=Athelia psychrophila TaxID=1759441 RepID=A0A167UYH4_9AGAM|nr:hypothetical protein FIBSPDRAFT_878513 [Fibularhizoctonia sp. CBS 109695]
MARTRMGRFRRDWKLMVCTYGLAPLGAGSIIDGKELRVLVLDFRASSNGGYIWCMSDGWCLGCMGWKRTG